VFREVLLQILFDTSHDEGWFTADKNTEALSKKGKRWTSTARSNARIWTYLLLNGDFCWAMRASEDLSLAGCACVASSQRKDVVTTVLGTLC
jgi:hypothetical protein